jgi:hypothetical protein
VETVAEKKKHYKDQQQHRGDNLGRYVLLSILFRRPPFPISRTLFPLQAPRPVYLGLRIEDPQDATTEHVIQVPIVCLSFNLAFMFVA